MGRATGVYSIKRGPTALRAVGNKEMVPPGGTREKSSGVTMPSAPPEAKSTPDTPTGRVGIAPVKPPLCKGRCPRSGRRDCLAGFRLPAGFPRGGGAFSLRYVGVQGAFHLPVEHYGFTPPGAFSLGPLQRPVLFSLRRSRCGASAPRRECGVRRREPLCGATGVYQIKGDPAALCAVGNKREWGAGKHPSWRGLKARPLAA